MNSHTHNKYPSIILKSTRSIICDGDSKLPNFGFKLEWPCYFQNRVKGFGILFQGSVTLYIGFIEKSSFKNQKN